MYVLQELYKGQTQTNYFFKQLLLAMTIANVFHLFLFTFLKTKYKCPVRSWIDFYKNFSELLKSERKNFWPLSVLMVEGGSFIGWVPRKTNFSLEEFRRRAFSHSVFQKQPPHSHAHINHMLVTVSDADTHTDTATTDRKNRNFAIKKIPILFS